jgi:hypothetical protein
MSGLHVKVVALGPISNKDVHSPSYRGQRTRTYMLQGGLEGIVAVIRWSGGKVNLGAQS